MVKISKKENQNYICITCKIYKVKNHKKNKCSICDIEKIRSKRKIINKFLRKEKKITYFTLPKIYPFLIENNFQINKNEKKCFHCAKKIGIFSFYCKCKNFFCKNHKFSEKHNCSFNFQQFEKNILRKNNLKIKKNKILYF